MRKLAYQEKAINEILTHIEMNQDVLVQSPTGSGKTYIAGQAIKKYLKNNKGDKRVLFLCNLQVLLGQTYDEFTDLFLKCSVIHGEINKSPKNREMNYSWQRRILITMPETFLNTVSGENNLSFYDKFVPDVIFIDEVHKGTTSSYQMIKNLFPNAMIVGLTATPYRDKSDEGEHLREWFKHIITTCSINDLIEQKMLVRPKYFTYDESFNIVETWKKHTSHSANKKTIVFSQNTQHSIALKDAFINAGITAEIITAGSDVAEVGKQSANQRLEIFEKFANGELDVLISVIALCEGFNERSAKYCMLLRKVENHALYHQMIGRILRTHPSKKHCEVLDFCSNIKKHGPVEDYEWTLQNETSNTTFIEKQISVSLMKKMNKVFYTCSCHHVFDIKKHEKCPSCKKAHDVKFAMTIGEFLIENAIDLKKMKEIKQRVATALKNMNDFYADIFQAKANEISGLELFINGNINPLYKNFVDNIENTKAEIYVQYS